MCRTPFLRLEGHAKGVFSCAWSSRYRFVVSGGADKSLCVFNPFSGNRQAAMSGHQATVTHVGVNDADHQVISLSMVCHSTEALLACDLLGSCLYGRRDGVDALLPASSRLYTF